ncbi:MAG: tetratricopeptide repeat protein [Methanoregula sp.]|jgi:tetratricopeptide (TPR) repeat protein|uniref:tetratricopeptide repeat protein n=1 Tax=Methanoregula sp. TaxID=2052170 RepID=UPI003C2466E2
MTTRYPSRLIIVIGIALLVLCTPVLAYSSDATGWYGQGNAFLASGNYTEAVAAYDRAISLEPSYFEAWDAKADALNRNGRFSDALDASARALAINPDYAHGWINRGQILYNIGYVYEDQKKDLTTANEYYNQQLLAFEKAIELDPGNADAWFNKGYALAGLKRYDEAIAAFDKVQELNPDYPKIAQNKQIAQQLKDTSTPDYVKYVPVLAGIAVVIIGIVVWFVFLREKKE